VTAAVVTANVAPAAPAEITAFAGTLTTAVLLLESDTDAPPAGAPVVSVTVPIEPFPPMTVAGLVVTDTRVGGAGTLDGVSLVTNASAQKIRRSPFQTRSKAPGVVGKSDEPVSPVTYALPAVSTAMPRPSSMSVAPPR